MIDLSQQYSPENLQSKIERVWQLSAEKILRIEKEFDISKGAPVFTVDGKYSTRGWTEWTQGFQFGSAILQFDASGDEKFLEIGRQHTLERMASHVTHTGVHDHGFNNVSTYGNLLRLMNESRISENQWERAFYELALKCSGAVQAHRWTDLGDNRGYVYSFNGPQSLFVDTIRSLRSLGVAHQLGHALSGENDRRISLLDRMIQHMTATADYIVFYGKNRDGADVRGRVVHEAIFNLNDGNFRCPSSQQGYSPFTTWTRGLAWCLSGYAEELEFIATLEDEELEAFGGRTSIEAMMREAACAAADFYIENTPTCGIPYWDTGAPTLHKLGDYLDRPADPYNDYEPVDSSAAAIVAQGFLRLGKYLQSAGDVKGERYWQTGLKILDTLFDEPYLSSDTSHHGLLLHSVYHWPNRWDHVPAGKKIACGESTMWGDYHAREVALYLQRLINDEPYLTFYLT